MDGVLFLEAAYSLAPRGAAADFGHEAIEVPLKRMEDDRGGRCVLLRRGADIVRGLGERRCCER
jgi:hypothetical protein